jgi:hypothetical protein
MNFLIDAMHKSSCHAWHEQTSCIQAFPNPLDALRGVRPSIDLASVRCVDQHGFEILVDAGKVCAAYPAR